ncbi:hypothetical protein [Kitasatospora sp. NPDC089509]|uniref:hypothetical protein n=1 Tax=Kitasatospora sp. NPDC089509 TaxID=3364079 RepID=UPI0038125CF0
MNVSDDDTMRVIPGNEPVTEVTVHMHMVYGAHLPDPLDTLVLLHLMFMVAGGTSPTAAKVLAALRAEGIQAGNGSGLIGRDAVQASFRRLTEAGFLRRIGQAQGQKGRFGGAGYELYRRPAYNPDWMPSEALHAAGSASASPQVTPQTAMPGTAVPRKRRKRISAGQTVDGNAGHGVTGNGNAGHGGSTVSAGQTVDGNTGHGSGFPPHPPGEVGTTSSPSPHGRHMRDAAAAPRSGRAGAGLPAEVAADSAPVDPELFRAAVDFLMRLPGKWAVGRLKARNLASELVRAIEDTGWKLDASLRMWLTRAEEGKAAPRVHGTVLEFRIKNLELREAVFATEDTDSEQAAALPAQARPQTKPRTPEWCGKCNDGERPMSLMMRTIADPDLESDRVLPCPDCHPSRVRFAR